MPAQNGFRTDDHQARAPIAPPRQPGQARARRGIDTTRLPAPLLEECELTTQDQVLGFDGLPRSDREREQSGHIGQQSKDYAKQNDHAAIMPQPANSRVTSSGRAESSFCRAHVSLETRRLLLGHKNGDITTLYSAAEFGELIAATNRISTAKGTPSITLLRVANG